MKAIKKLKIKGCSCYGVNSMHKCFCITYGKSNKSNISESERITNEKKYKTIKNTNKSIFKS